MSFAGDAAQKPMRHALRELRRIGVRHLRLREFMQGQRLVKSIAPDGSFELDYSLLDKTFDYVVRELGYQLTVTVETTPNQLSVMPGPDDYVYAHPYPPRDLKIWRNILQAVVGHWIDRYGKACVAEWTFECWNEPNASYFFKGTEAEFAEIFGAYLDALTEIERKHDIRLQIGTMSAAGVTPWFFSCLEKARAIGKLDAIDALSLHLYAGFIGSMGTLRRRRRPDAPDCVGIPSDGKSSDIHYRVQCQHHERLPARYRHQCRVLRQGESDFSG